MRDFFFFNQEWMPAFSVAFCVYWYDQFHLKIFLVLFETPYRPHMDYRPPGSSVHGILQARILEWVAIPFSRGSSQPRDWTWVSHITGRFFTVWATREAQYGKLHWFLNIQLSLRSLDRLYLVRIYYPFYTLLGPIL